MNNDTPAQRKLTSFLKKRDPKLSDKELGSLLRSIKRFVTVVQKIYTEPQAQIKYKDFVENGVTIKKRIIDTNMEELSKASRGLSKRPIAEVFREFTEKITGVKYKIHGK